MHFYFICCLIKHFKTQSCKIISIFSDELVKIHHIVAIVLFPILVNKITITLQCSCLPIQK